VEDTSCRAQPAPPEWAIELRSCVHHHVGTDGVLGGNGNAQPQRTRESALPAREHRSQFNKRSGQAGGPDVIDAGRGPLGWDGGLCGRPTAWNALFNNYYGPDPKHQNSDLAFIEEWDAAIDAYGQIFNGVTLILTTTTDALPTFPAASDPSVFTPAPGFESDCDDATTGKDADLSAAMACAAVTQVLAHFTDPLVGGNNAKSTQEDGMTAARDGQDLGTNAVKWLAATTSGSGPAPPGSPNRLPRIPGGMEFSHSFSDLGANPRFKYNDVQEEGCPTLPKPLWTGSDGTTSTFTPGEGLANVLSSSFFPGAAVRPPMNYMQIYDNDILYAAGLSSCSVLQMEGRPASPRPESARCRLIW
jgi:hypothetical protein